MDPTLEEMRKFLSETVADSDTFDREEAIYWFASLYHSGQASNLYAALCKSEYTPGPLTEAPALGENDCFDVLTLKYIGT